MLRPKKGFENSQVSFRVGSNTFTINVKDITPELVDKVKHHTDLTYFVEEVEKHEPKKYITKYDPELHDIETIVQRAINQKEEELSDELTDDILDIINEEEPKKKTRKKKKP